MSFQGIAQCHVSGLGSTGRDRIRFLPTFFSAPFTCAQNAQGGSAAMRSYEVWIYVFGFRLRSDITSSSGAGSV